MDYIVETNFQGPGFVAVPNAVARNDQLSAEALGVLVFLASMPHGFLTRVASIQERFGFGKDKWQRIAKELREAGAMVVEAVRGSGGRVVGKRVSIQWPEQAEATESRKTRPSDRKPEKPTVGKPANQSRKIRQTGPENPAPYKEEEKHTAREHAQDRARPTSNKATSKLHLDDLSGFLICQLNKGEAFVVGSGKSARWLKPEDADFCRLQDDLRMRDQQRARMTNQR